MNLWVDHAVLADEGWDHGWVTSPSDSVDPADIRRVDDAQIVWSDAVPSGNGMVGGVSLDPEVARAFAAKLSEIAVALGRIDIQLESLAVPSPADDDVSRNAVIQASTMIEASRHYVQRWRSQLATAGIALERQLAAYEQVENSNEARVDV